MKATEQSPKKENLIDRKNEHKKVAEKLYADYQALHALWKKKQIPPTR